MPTAGTLASDMSADSDGGKEDKAPAHVSNKTAHIKTMPENSNYEKSELDKFVLKVIPNNLKGGAADVKVHPYFQKIDWTRLTSRKIKAPWTPQLDNKLDLSNFDTYDEDDQVPEFTGDQSPFSSF